MRAIKYIPSRRFKGFLRPLLPCDLNEVWQLDLRCFMDGEAYDKETFRYLLSRETTIARQIRSEYNEMTAFALAVIEHDGVGHLTTIGVAPEYRRRGLARLMLHEIERTFIARNIGTIRLEVRINNKPAITLYDNLGYAIVHKMNSYYSNNDDGFLMVKSLT